MLLLGLWY